MAKRLNRNLYQDKQSGVYYFQKKVRGIEKPYKFSLETTSIVEARRKRDEYLKQIELHGQIIKEEPIPVDALTEFGEVAQKWAEIVKPDLAETTFIRYRRVMNTHILPKFGNKAVDNITALDIETFISRLQCGSKTKLNILTPFRLVMKFAKKHGFIQINPFVDVDPIKKTKSRQKRPLTLDEIDRFIVAVDNFWTPLFVFLFFSGVRVGEATGLKWKRVDFPNSIVKIRKAIVRGDGGKIIYKEPKTASSIRDVKLPGFVLAALREQRKRTWKGDGDNFGDNDNGIIFDKE